MYGRDNVNSTNELLTDQKILLKVSVLNICAKTDNGGGGGADKTEGVGKILKN